MRPTARPVEPWVVLYAIRYGLGRFTYAHSDAIGLIKTHWSDLEEWSDSIVHDLEDIADGRRAGLADESIAKCVECLQWIAAQGPSVYPGDEE